MGLDLVKALKAPFSAEGWVSKLLVGGILICIPIVNFITMGYMVKYGKNLLNKDESLPSYSNIGDLFVSGIKLFIGSIILSIPVMLLCFIISMLFSKTVFVSTLLIYLIYFVYYFIAMVLMIRFSLDEKILSMIDFQSAFDIFNGNKNLLSFILLFIASSLAYGIVVTICCITIIGVILVPFLVYASLLSLYNLSAQFVVSAPKFEEVKLSIK